ncbi:glycosyltransferase family 4 protein [Rhodopirellula sp. JC740]|uniref:Glycosyltransferase family 4 protein n=1 Tax=Rhodopirellula halodulae TaxID=2894198 RepID=A0ABS8NP80_9BACT|nr:glycosyltransferase family 4 protein [Rhodopirellula sp. JC740]MCC9645362.1 glycosyltransferase family 4 protein [Rhodopirellula sp. JC740]
MSAVLPSNSDSNSSSPKETQPFPKRDLPTDAVMDGSDISPSADRPHPAEVLNSADRLDAKVVFLTHYIPLYQVRVLQEITRRIRDFQILLSTPIEPNRNFELDWSELQVQVQKTVTLRRRWRHAKAGFDDPLFVHVPYDTISQLKRLSPDVVVSHELGARSLAAARYCRRSGARLVLATFMSEHTEQGRGRMRSWARRRLLRSADAITYNGPSCRDYLLSLGARPEQLFHLPYAADDRTIAKEIAPRDESSVRRRLLCIGQLTQRKGVLPLVQQASQFCASYNESLEITFVGDGPCRSELETLASGQVTESIAKPDSKLSIHVLGNRPAAELPELMRQHGAIIAPTLADEWLLVTNEGMHAGMPILGSVYAQSVTTLIQDGRNGWQYDPLADESDSNSAHAISGLSGALQRYLAASDETIANMRVQAREDIRDYTPERSADGALQAIRSALGNRKPTASRETPGNGE